MVVPLTSEVTERAPELMPGEATGQVCARVGSRASFGVRGVDTERILEVDAVFTSSVMCTKQTVKPPAVRLSRHPGIHLAVQRRGAGVVRRDRRDCPVTANPSAW